MAKATRQRHAPDSGGGMSDNPVLVLGCGPSGLLSAYACELLGGTVAIMSRKVRSELPGAQYLHEPIPGLTGEPDGTIKTIRRGTAGGYARKVYGAFAARTSWNSVAPEREVWDLRAVYARLWDRYQPQIVDTEIGRTQLREFTRMFPLVISTIPATVLCAPEGRRTMEGIGDHAFRWQRMYTVDVAPDWIEDNTVVYSGDPDEPWYRSSRVFGHASTEATPHCCYGERVTDSDPTSRSPTIPLKNGIKVIGTNCDCFPEIKRAGRYGTWSKGYLTHHAFADATRYYTEAFGAG